MPYLLSFLLRRHPHHNHHCHHLLRRLSTSSSPSIPLSFPTFQIWSSNTSLGKTLVSTGLAFSTIFSSPSKFLYLKPIQTGFPTDSDSLFLFRKLSSLSLLHTPPFPLHLSHHVLRSSLPAARSLLLDGSQSLDLDGNNMVELGIYEEKLVGNGKEGGKGGEVVSRMGWGWKEPVSPELAAEREGGKVGDVEVVELVRRCLRNECEDKERDGREVICLVETAGGVASPGPSGTLQCDLYR